jgi:glycosyltransferase involved in cell wall biosynthesis
VIPHNPFVERYRQCPQELAEFDGVFSMSWTMSPLNILKHAKRSCCLVTCGGLIFDRQREGDFRTKVVTASRNTRRARERLPQFDGVVAVNQEGYEAALQYNPNTVLIPSGINMDFYKPGPPIPVNPDCLTVGWCGQKRCNVKGQNEILNPLMKRLEGEPIRFIVNDRNFDSALSREQMLEWYHGIDVLLCTSIIEGTPSPIFEAVSCGRIAVSTSVGMVADWGVAKHLGVAVPDYRNQAEANATVTRLAELLMWAAGAEPDTLRWYAMRLRKSLIGWCDYETVTTKYLEFIAG